MNIEVISIVCDGNPCLDDAVKVLMAYMPHAVKGFRPTIVDSAGAIEAMVIHDARHEIITALTNAKFRVIEGGQQ